MKLSKFKAISSSIALISMLGLTGCGSDSDSVNEVVEGAEVAVIAAVASDFGSSSISVAESENAEEIVNGYAPSDKSDMRVATYGDYFYRIGRFNQDNITKYSFENPSVAEWQFSVNDEGQTGANPYEMIFVSETKAYVLRYGASSLLIVNPSVTADDEENFVLGSIDLSAYDAVDSKPEMSNAVLHEGRLYITLQGLDTVNGYVPGQAYLVVIDTETDTEVNTGKGGDLAGVPLTIENPQDLDLRNNALYITGIGRYYPVEYSGGIEKVSVNDFSSSIVLDDGDDESHPYGQFSGLEFISDDELVFRGYEAWGSESLYKLTLSNGEVSRFYGVDGRNIKAIGVDEDGRFWLGLGYVDSVNDPVIMIINPENETLVSELNLTKDPSQIVFGRRTD